MVVLPLTNLILAVHDAGLVWMELQSTTRKSLGDGHQHPRGLALVHAVDHGVICITLEADIGELPRHPTVKRMCKNRLDSNGEIAPRDLPLRGDLGRRSPISGTASIGWPRPSISSPSSRSWQTHFQPGLCGYILPRGQAIVGATGRGEASPRSALRSQVPCRNASWFQRGVLFASCTRRR
jgi:hypothetical protein